MSDTTKQPASDGCNYSTPAPRASGSFVVSQDEYNRVIEGLSTQLYIQREFRQRERILFEEWKRDHDAQMGALRNELEDAKRAAFGPIPDRVNQPGLPGEIIMYRRQAILRWKRAQSKRKQKAKR